MQPGRNIYNLNLINTGFEIISNVFGDSGLIHIIKAI